MAISAKKTAKLSIESSARGAACIGPDSCGSVAVALQQIQQPVTSDEVQGSHHHQHVVIGVQQRFDLRQPLAVALAEQLVVERGRLGAFLEELTLQSAQI